MASSKSELVETDVSGEFKQAFEIGNKYGLNKSTILVVDPAKCQNLSLT